MSPEAKRRLLLGGGVALLCALVGVLSGVLTRSAITRQSHAAAQRLPAQDVAPEAAPAPTAAPSLAAGPGDGDPKAAAEHPQQQESIYMVLGPDSLAITSMSGSGMALPWAGVGPCRQLRTVSNISLDLSAAATGCRGMQCVIGLRVTLPLAGACPDLPGPYPTVFMISGYTCQPQYYATIVGRMASWGYAVVQYERPLGGTYQPSSETESLYWQQVLAWRDSANGTWRDVPGSLAGQFAAGPVAVTGHSMGGGLASIQAGLHPELGAVVLLDPVDFTAMSLRVARRFLADYHKPVLILTVGVHCVDRRGCVPPQDHTPTDAENAAWVAAGACQPSWSCCDWDDGTPGLETKTLAGITQPTDGPSGFVEVAAPGSWVGRLPQAGHLSFVEPGSRVFGGITSCPAVAQPATVQMDAAALAIAFLEFRLRGQAQAEALTLAWAAGKPAQELVLSVKQLPIEHTDL